MDTVGIISPLTDALLINEDVKAHITAQRLVLAAKDQGLAPIVPTLLFAPLFERTSDDDILPYIESASKAYLQPDKVWVYAPNMAAADFIGKWLREEIDLYKQEAPLSYKTMTAHFVADQAYKDSFYLAIDDLRPRRYIMGANTPIHGESMRKFTIQPVYK